MKIRTAPFTLAASLSALMLSAAPALAQHGEHGQHEHEEAEIVEPDTYAHALEVIHAQLEKIEGLMDRRQLDRVHKEAAVIRDVAKTLVRLALEQHSGVPRSAIREINLTGKDLAAKFGPIDEAGDSGNLAGTRKVYDEMVALFKTLEEYLPQRYACPMRCEPGKTYNAPGRCPVCHMYLKKMTDEYSVEAKPLTGVLKPGESTLVITIRDPAGAVVKNLEVVHEKVLHLLMVSNDLSWYGHKHPEVQRDGSFRLRVTFPRGGEYVLFHDFTPSGAGSQVVPATLRVEGTSPPRARLKVDSSSTKQVDGYAVTLDTAGAIYAGHEAVLSYYISRDGRPVTDLEAYLGAKGHLVVISEDLKQFVHSHPLGEEHHGGGNHEDDEHASQGHDEHSEHGGVAVGSKKTVVTFHAQIPEPGLYKAWVEFKHQGRIITVPFVIDVKLSAEDGHHDHH